MIKLLILLFLFWAIKNPDKAKSVFSGSNPRNEEQVIEHAEKAEGNNSIPFLKRKPSRFPAIAALGLGTFAALSNITDLFAVAAAPGTIIPAAILVVIGILAIAWGVSELGLIERFHRYAGLAGDSEYADIKDLAFQTGKSEKYVRKQLLKMIKKGMIPGARFDDDKSTLILTDQAYREYRKAKRAEMQRQMEEENRKAQEGTAEGVSGERTDESARLLAEGEDFLREIQQVAEKIASPSMTQEIFDLAGTVNQIMESLRRDPSSADSLRKYLNYYIPTVRKMIRAYGELEDQPDSENVRKTRAEIEEAVQSVNAASQVLMDNLLQDSYWDISSDIAVMKQMMERDGLSQTSEL